MKTTRLLPWMKNLTRRDVLGFLCLAVGLLPVAASAQSVDPNFRSSPDGPVYALAVQPDGKILAGGGFTALGGYNRTSVCRIEVTGDVDANYYTPIGTYPGNGDDIHCVAVRPNGRNVVGGDFTLIRDHQTLYLAGLDSWGLNDLTMGDEPGPVRALAIQADDMLLVACHSYNGLQNLRRHRPSGSEDYGFGVASDGQIECIAVEPSGSILVGGSFWRIGGQARSRIARLLPDGTVDSLFNPGANSTVQTLVVQPDGKILVGGGFSTIGGQPRSLLARLNADGSVDAGFNPGARFYSVNTFALQADGRILVGGDFSELAGRSCRGLGRLLPDGSADWSFATSIESSVVHALALQADGRLLVGGEFPWFHGYPFSNLGRLENIGLATQSLTFDSTSITWLRGGTSPEAWRTTFESSTDGVNWTLLGAGTRIPGGWRLTATMPPGANVRARGWTTGGKGNGSAWFVESRTGPPIIVSQPASQTFCAGARMEVRLGVAATGNEPLTYQWRLDDNNLADGLYVEGATTPNLRLVEPSAGNYTVVIANSFGSTTSVVATLSAVARPVMLQHPSPSSQWRNRGEDVSYAVAMEGPGPFYYQWRKNYQSLPGQTNPWLTLRNLQAADAGIYDVVVANQGCSVKSPDAVLRVNLALPDTFQFDPAGMHRAHCSRLVIQPDGKVIAWGEIGILGVPPFSALFRRHADSSVDWSFKVTRSSSMDTPNSLQLQPDGKLLFHASPFSLLRLQPDGNNDEGFQWWGWRDKEWVECCSTDPEGHPMISYVHSPYEVRSGSGGDDGCACDKIFGQCPPWCWRGANPILSVPWEFFLYRLQGSGAIQAELVAARGGDQPFPEAVPAMSFQPNGQMLIGYSPFTPGYRRPQLLARLHANAAFDPTFGPVIGGGDYVNRIVVQPDGKVLIGGNFDSLSGQPRRFFGRLQPNGEVDASFDAGLDGAVGTIALQTDGRILIQGNFTSVRGQPQPTLARLNPDGTLDDSFNPQPDGPVLSIALQADGKVVVGGAFSRIGGDLRLGLARLANTELATEELTYTLGTVTWRRGGTSPEVWRSTFDITHDGVNWSPLGVGTRIPGGWQLTGISAPWPARVRARGFVVNGGTVEYLVESYAGAPVPHKYTYNYFPIPGKRIILKANAAGTPPFNVSWQKGGVALTDDGHISGSSTLELSLTDVTETDAGDYSVVLENSFGSATSVVATVSFGAPSIAQPPEDAIVPAGGTAVFSVEAGGTPPFSYQWRKDGVPLAGADGSTYGIASAIPADAGGYDVIVSNSFGSVTSRVARLFYDLPIIVAPPANQAVHLRDIAVFSVEASGGAPLSYQWLFHGMPLIGRTNSTHVIAFPTPDLAGEYSVVVSNTHGAVTSAVAVLTYLSDHGTNGLNFTDGWPVPHLDGETADGCTSWTDSWPLDNSFEGRSGTTNLPGGVWVKWDSANTWRAGLENDSDQQLYRVYLDDGDASLVTGDGIGVSVTLSNLTSWLLANHAVSYRIRCYASSDYPTYPTGGFEPVSVRLGAPDSADGVNQLLNLPVLETFTITSAGDGAFPTASGMDGIRGYGDSTYLNTADVITLTLPSRTHNDVRGTLAGLVLEYDTDTVQPPSVVRSPQSTNVATGASVTLQVAAMGTPWLGYLWRKDGVPFLVTNVPSLTLASVTPGDLGGYDVIVANAWGAVTSAVATLTIAVPPQITVPPQSVAAALGAAAGFQVTASGTAPLGYQWRKNGVALPAATSVSLDFPVVQATDAGNYDVVVSNVLSAVTSAPVTLTVSSFALGALRADYFTGLSGTLLADLTNSAKFLNNTPDLTESATQLESRKDWADNYGARLSGWLIPPVSGSYKFYLASDDQGVLFLSTNASPSNKTVIAFEPQWNGYRQFTNGQNQATRGNSPTNISPNLTLVAGRSYYVEALLKEGTGGDHLAVAWLPPGGLPVTNNSPPIAGQHLSTRVPYRGGLPWPVPGVIEGENFDEGGEGVAYHDLEAVNLGGRDYRPGGVDIGPVDSGGYKLAYSEVGEWLNYTIHVQSNGLYRAVLRATSGSSGGVAQLDFSNGSQGNLIVVPPTGGWQDWTNCVSQVFPLSAGVQTLRFSLVQTPFDWDSLEIVPANVCVDGLLAGALKAEYFTNITGGTLPDLTNHTRFLAGQPDLVTLSSQFESMTNWTENYGVRLSGWLVPPVNGYYRFYLAADDQAELRLSTDASAANAERIAFEPVWNNPREFRTGINQAARGSPPVNIVTNISLVAGRAYYVEALGKEATGGDHLAVAWLLPGGPAVTNGSPSIASQFLACGTAYAPGEFAPLSAAGLTNSGQVCVGFGRMMELDSATRISNYQVTGATVSSATLSPDRQSVLLNVAGLAGASFTLRVGAVRDIFGNSTPASTELTGRVLPLRRLDIGTPGDPLVAGTTFCSRAGEFDVIASGTDLWNVDDHGHFILRTLTGDFDAMVRVASLTRPANWTKAGLVARASTNANSRHVALVATPANGENSYQFLWRATNSASSVSIQRGNGGLDLPPACPNAWLRLKRTGSLFSGYISTNGADWLLFAERDTATNAGGALPATLEVGLAVTSHNNTSEGTAVAQFRDFVLAGPGGNLAPVSTGFSATTPQDQPLAIALADLLAPVRDPEGGPVRLVSVDTLSVSGASVLSNGAQIVYAPAPGFVGADRFNYRVTDNLGAESIVSAQIAVLPEGVAVHAAGTPEMTGTAAAFGFTGLPGRTYRVLRATDIEGPWNAVGIIAVLPDGFGHFSDPAPPAESAFYRLLLLNP